MQPVSIRSQPPWPAFQPSRSPSRPRPGVARVFLLFFLLLLGGFAVVTYWPSSVSRTREASAPAVSADRAIPVALSEDLLRHLESAIGGMSGAAAEIKRSQDWTGRIVPTLEKNYLAVEKRRLEAAEVAANSARRHIEETREELMTIRNLLIERTKQ